MSETIIMERDNVGTFKISSANMSYNSIFRNIYCSINFSKAPEKSFNKNFYTLLKSLKEGDKLKITIETVNKKCPCCGGPTGVQL